MTQSAMPEEAHAHHGHDDHVPERVAGETRPPESMAHDDIETNAMHEGHEEAEHEMHAGHGHEGHGGHGGHGGHAGHEAMFRTRFWISLILSIPVVLSSHMIQDWFGYSMPDFPGSDWVAPVLGTVIFFYGGAVFLGGGWDELKQRQPGMMLLISLAITVAFVASIATTFGWLDLDYWWELALLVTIMLLGHWMEMRALGETQNALQALAELVPDEAERITDGGTEIVPASELRNDDLVLVRPGSSVPADGVIEEGRAEFDESMITGESRPVTHGEGDHIVAGTVVAGSSVRFRVDATGEENDAGRHPAHGRAGAAVQIARAGPGRPLRRPAVLRRDRRGRDHLPRSGGSPPATWTPRSRGPSRSSSSRAPMPSAWRSRS